MEFEELLKDFGDLILQKVEMSFLAEIISYSAESMTATIRPQLFNVNNDGKNSNNVLVPDVQNVPVELIFGIVPQYLKGDIVSVRCYASAIKPPLSGQRSNQGSNRFQFNSCSVSAGLLRKTPIGNYISFDGTAVNVTGKLKVSDDISTLADVVAGLISLKTHTHEVTTAPGTTGPPLP